MESDRAIFDRADPNAEAMSIKRAREDFLAGRSVDHEAVAAWLRTWGGPDERPAPREWLE